MYVPDEVRQCVVFVGLRLKNGEYLYGGTAFYVGRPILAVGLAFKYFVTAKHVIKGIQNHKDFDGKIVLRVNLKDGTVSDIETDFDKWLFHPEKIEIDVAILANAGPFSNFAEISYLTISDYFLTENIRKRHEIGLGDELFVIGLFVKHKGRARNIPIVRVGNLSAMPEETINTKMGFINGYLVESRSIGGLSGSPVFITVSPRIEKGSIPVGTGEREKSSFYLLGLMHGHYDTEVVEEGREDVPVEDLKTRAEDVVNMGIGIVIPTEDILEVIEQPMIRDPEARAEKAVKGELPPMDRLSDEERAVVQAKFEQVIADVKSQVGEPGQ